MLCIPVLATQSYLEVDCAVTVCANNAAKSRTAFEALGLPIAPTKGESIVFIFGQIFLFFVLIVPN
jgi:hypothetical protein